MTDADSLHHTDAMAQDVKRRAPDALVCLGGPASSPIADQLMAQFRLARNVLPRAISDLESARPAFTAG
jgi:hypothetical protein